MQLRLMPDYGCDPLWEVLPDGVRNLPASKLPISKELALRIERWKLAYDATLVREDPVRSGFASPTAENAFEEEGRAIWGMLREELGPAHDVSYFSQRTHRVLDATDV